MKICVDRPLLNQSLPERDFSLVTAPPRINSDGSISTIAVKHQPLAGETLKMWSPGETIKVFLSTTNGSDAIREQIKLIVKEWERIANINFQFVTSKSDAKIKVWFASNKKYWSWIGRDVLFNPFDAYTMNLGFINSGITTTDVRAIVLHEFGHALGFIHEHQSPASGIQWDKEKVYAFFAEEPNKWSRAEVDLNVFNRYARTTTNYSAYDPASIMHYEIPAELTTTNTGTTYNTNFSYIDMQYARALYPFPVYNSGATGTLRTGDDCDLIDFRVDYNVVPKDKIEFILELGTNSSGRNITWWKQIAVPLKNGTEAMNWVQNHSLIASENRTSYTIQVNAADIDRTKGISFWKAKLLGVHTLLPYKWPVLEALTGGCRVKLTWKNDKCG
ncbi:M12 family metallopeptidase [Lacibacter luteus]|nr:M12 family metallopeptidase [Lacibacter luteus]